VLKEAKEAEGRVLWSATDFHHPNLQFTSTRGGEEEEEEEEKEWAEKHQV